ncbi:hypothetical protein RCOM_1328080 [Ricinus communis]|uniref:F-box domain-containing protein n=1 Tax=Ricinus communis TaxID=3988 RepID=B9S265_RICCO|nr:hypothetical protein RCOM_1328080 [Ricinus communis]
MKTEGGLGIFHKNLQSLACVLLSRNVNPTNIEKGFLERQVLGFDLDPILLKELETAVMNRTGKKQNGQTSDDSLLPGLHDDTTLDILAWSSRSDYTNLAYVNRKFKALIGSGYLYKLRRRLGVIEDWFYLACILMPWKAFDPVRQRWMQLPRMSGDECFTYANKESLCRFAIWMYNLLSYDWSRCAAMNLPCCLFGSSIPGEIAIVAGESDKNGCILSGMLTQTECLSCGEEYKLETRIWRRIENMYSVSSVGHPAMRSPSPPLVAVVNNQLYSVDQATNMVKRYDKTNNTWSIVKRLLVRVDSSHGWGLAFKAYGSSLLVTGGHRGPEGEVIVIHSWDPQDIWMDQTGMVLAVKQRADAFVYNCAVMGC